MRRQQSPALTMVYAHVALSDLSEIAEWNESTYGRNHAERYIAFLERHINTLMRDYAGGRIVPTRPDLRFVLIRKSSQGRDISRFTAMMNLQ